MTSLLKTAVALVATLAAIAVCPAPLTALPAQNAAATASLSGSIYDASAAAVPYANVVLKSVDGPWQEIVRAGAAGEYKLAAIKPGTYDIEVRAPGFALLRKAGVALAAGTSATLDLTLELGGVQESIDVVGPGTRPAVAPSSTPRRIRVGGNVQATRLLKRVPPAYPANALAAGITGTVLLRAVISTSGDLLGLSVINTVDPGLAAAATDAVRQWKYQPTLLNGAPVEVVTTIAVNFKLES